MQLLVNLKRKGKNMIIKDKAIRKKQEYLFNLILAMARIQKIHPTILKEEAVKIKSNAMFLANMFKKKGQNETNKNNTK